MALSTIKGPAIFLAQFAGDTAPFNSWDSITKWAAGHGFVGVQVPTWDGRLFDLKNAAKITELSTHLQAQLGATHPAYDEQFDGFAPKEMRGNPKKRQAWAVDQVMLAAKASKNLGLKASVPFSGALAWPFIYPFPQRPAGLVETAFDELARRWK